MRPQSNATNRLIAAGHLLLVSYLVLALAATERAFLAALRELASGSALWTAPAIAVRPSLNARLAAIDVKAKGGLLPNVILYRGVQKIMPIEKFTPPVTEALVARLYAMLPLPRIRITDLLSEVERDGRCSPTASPSADGETAGNVVIPEARPQTPSFARALRQMQNSYARISSQ